MQKCGCVPWNYPHFNLTLDVCDFMGADCFEAMMADTDTNRRCDTCLYDCDSTRFGYSVSSTKLDVDKICDSKAAGFGFYSDQAYSPPKMFMRSYQQVVDDVATNMEDICRENMKGVAVAQFQLSGQIVTQIKRDIRVTAADTLSNYGELMYIFLGRATPGDWRQCIFED